MSIDANRTGGPACTPEWYAWVDTVTAYTDSEVTAGRTYRYAVSSLRLYTEPGRESAWSGQLTATARTPRQPVRPGAPKGLSARANGSRVALSWTAPTSGDSPASYSVYRDDGNGCGNLRSVHSGLAADSTYFEDTTVTDGNTYCYQMTAWNSGGESSRSGTAVVKAVAPGPPTGLRAASASETEIGLGWTAPEDNGGGAVDSYNVHRCEPDDGEPCTPEWHAWVEKATEYIDTEVIKQATYQYAISSLRLHTGSGRESLWSNPVAVVARSRAHLPPDVWRGVDLSYVNELEDCEAVYRSEGAIRDPFEILADEGANIARFRLWHTPDWTDYGTLEDVMKSIGRAKTSGMRVLLDFHYSDDWADPGNQQIPLAWRSAESVEEIEDLLYDYTFESLITLHEEGLLPDYVQVGNEINNGLAHSDPAVDSWEANPERNVSLVNSGITAVRDVANQTGHHIGVILHIAQPENVEAWLDRAEARVPRLADFDAIGVSYYPQWSRLDLAEVERELERLRHKYGKEIVIVETAYPWTLQNNDSSTNILDESSLLDGYPATVDGQRNFLIDQLDAVLQAEGLGVIYWEPAWISTSCSTRWAQGSAWENAALFDYENSELHEGADFLSFNFNDRVPVDIPDSNLRAAIEEALGKAADDQITRADMEMLVALEAEDRDIKDLTGLEFATYLTSLNLRNNAISDISVLTELPNLTSVRLDGNPLDDMAIGVHIPRLRASGVRVHWTPEEFEASHRVPLFPSASNLVRQGFARVINHSADGGEMMIAAIDDAGFRYGPVALSIEAGQTVHFNSDDLESGTANKGLPYGVGPGQGDWRLEFNSNLDLEVFAYVRTRDGFLTAMHDVAPSSSDGIDVVTFNPASNVNQVSRLRLINPGDDTAEVAISGVDDAGASPGNGVLVSVPGGESLALSSDELESGAGLNGSLGDGVGKWRLTVDSDREIVAMSLLENPGTGHLTNLSTIPAISEDDVHLVPLFPSASDALGRQGVARVVNRSAQAGQVRIEARDDAGNIYEPLTLALDAGETAHFNSYDLELGNADKGLTGSTGSGMRDWRLALTSALEIEVLFLHPYAGRFLDVHARCRAR